LLELGNFSSFRLDLERNESTLASATQHTEKNYTLIYVVWLNNDKQKL